MTEHRLNITRELLELCTNLGRQVALDLCAQNEQPPAMLLVAALLVDSYVHGRHCSVEEALAFVRVLAHEFELDDTEPFDS